MNTDEEVEAVLRAVRFEPRLSYSWFGEKAPRPRNTGTTLVSPDSRRRWMVHQLQAQLYRDFYCVGRPMRAVRELNGTSNGLQPFVRQLSAANMGNGFLSDGWTCTDSDENTVHVRKGGLNLWLRRKDLVTQRSQLLEKGTPVAPRFPKELLSISPGFYVALADKELVRRDEDVLVRVYWNITAEGAIALMREVTSAFNREDLSFKLKLLNHPANFSRCDAAVLYLCKSEFAKAASLLEHIYPEVCPYLKDSVPALTKKLARGVGLAEDPGLGESYGSHRCGVLAESLARIHELRRKSSQGQLAIIRSCFKENNISWDSPFLTMSSVDDYGFQPRAPQAVAPVSTTELWSGSFLQPAMIIGRDLVRDAVWCGDRCNWMSVSNEGHTSDTSSSREVCRPAGPDPYSGSSGIGLFLAQLYSVTGHSETQRCSRGAMLQALKRAEHISPAVRLGAYTGWTGIAVASAMAGKLLDDDHLLEASTTLIRRMSLWYDRATASDFDLVSGKAGAISGLLVLHDLLGKGSFLEFAKRLGEDLLGSARHTDAGCSWQAPAGHGNRQHLTGLAHGAAGAAFALIELFRVTRDDRYRQAAERAFDYERSWFNVDVNNWRDFRRGDHDSRCRDASPRFSTTWCHGAPGIALSRLRAHQVLRNPRYTEEALVALGTTCRMARAWLVQGTYGHSLCHGSLGNADILLQGWQVLGEKFGEGLAFAQELAHSATSFLQKETLIRYTGDSLRTPGLMLGTAGAGHFFLRLHDRRIPSVLSMAVTL